MPTEFKENIFLSLETQVTSGDQAIAKLEKIQSLKEMLERSETRQEKSDIIKNLESELGLLDKKIAKTKTYRSTFNDSNKEIFKSVRETNRRIREEEKATEGLKRAIFKESQKRFEKSKSDAKVASGSSGGSTNQANTGLPIDSKEIDKLDKGIRKLPVERLKEFTKLFDIKGNTDFFTKITAQFRGIQSLLPLTNKEIETLQERIAEIDTPTSLEDLVDILGTVSKLTSTDGKSPAQIINEVVEATNSLNRVNITTGDNVKNVQGFLENVTKAAALLTEVDENGVKASLSIADFTAKALALESTLSTSSPEGVLGVVAKIGAQAQEIGLTTSEVFALAGAFDAAQVEAQSANTIMAKFRDLIGDDFSEELALGLFSAQAAMEGLNGDAEEGSEEFEAYAKRVAELRAEFVKLNAVERIAFGARLASSSTQVAESLEFGSQSRGAASRIASATRGADLSATVDNVSNASELDTAEEFARANNQADGLIGRIKNLNKRYILSNKFTRRIFTNFSASNRVAKILLGTVGKLRKGLSKAASAAGRVAKSLGGGILSAAGAFGFEGAIQDGVLGNQGLADLLLDFREQFTAVATDFGSRLATGISTAFSQEGLGPLERIKVLGEQLGKSFDGFGESFKEALENGKEVANLTKELEQLRIDNTEIERNRSKLLNEQDGIISNQLSSSKEILAAEITKANLIKANNALALSELKLEEGIIIKRGEILDVARQDVLARISDIKAEISSLVGTKRANKSIIIEKTKELESLESSIPNNRANAQQLQDNLTLQKSIELNNNASDVNIRNRRRQLSGILEVEKAQISLNDATKLYTEAVESGASEARLSELGELVKIAQIEFERVKLQDSINTAISTQAKLSGDVALAEFNLQQAYTTGVDIQGKILDLKKATSAQAEFELRSALDLANAYDRIGIVLSSNADKVNKLLAEGFNASDAGLSVIASTIGAGGGDIVSETLIERQREELIGLRSDLLLAADAASELDAQIALGEKYAAIYASLGFNTNLLEKSIIKLKDEQEILNIQRDAFASQDPFAQEEASIAIARVGLNALQRDGEDYKDLLIEITEAEKILSIGRQRANDPLFTERAEAQVDSNIRRSQTGGVSEFDGVNQRKDLLSSISIAEKELANAQSASNSETVEGQKNIENAKEALIGLQNQLSRFERENIYVTLFGDYGPAIQELKNFASEFLKLQEELAQKAIEIQERRVDRADKLFQKGNAEALNREEAKLDKLIELREKASRRARAIAAVEIAINKALAISALIKQAAQSGPLAPAVIALIIASAAAGAIALGSAFGDIPAFIEGTDGTVASDPKMNKYKKSSGRDGYMARFDGQEKIFAPKYAKDLNGMTQAEVVAKVKMADQYDELGLGLYDSVIYPKLSDNVNSAVLQASGANVVDNTKELKAIKNEMTGMREELAALEINLNMDVKGFMSGYKKKVQGVNRVKRTVSKF